MAASLLVIGRVATLAGERGMGWAGALAISDGRVIAAGRPSELEPLTGAGTRRIHLAPDEVAIPALRDAHLHLLDAALADERVDLTGVDLESALARIAAAHQRLVDADAWLEGDGWDPAALGGWPDRSDLERVAPGRRAAFWAHDHHALWVSRRALVDGGISVASADPPGGVIRRGGDGTPTGVLHENAVPLVLDRIPTPSADRRTDAVARLARELVRAGVGAVHDPGALAADAGLGGVDVYRTLDAAGRLPLEVHVSVRRPSLEAAIAAGLRGGDPLVGEAGVEARARLGWLKLFADGSLGSRTAAMLAPYEDEAGSSVTGAGLPGSSAAPTGARGVMVTQPAELTALVARAAGAGIAGQVHAIGDAAVRAALGTLAGTAGRSATMPRIEHAQLVDRAELARFAREGVAASVQPVHLASDAIAARAAWGSRAERAYPYGSLRAAGALLAFGTDAPVEPWDPWPGLEAAVTRRSAAWPAGTPALAPAEAIDLSDALRAACLGPALVAGQRDRGRLVAGQQADLLVIPAAALAEPVVPGGSLGRVRPLLVLLRGVEAAAPSLP